MSASEVAIETFNLEPKDPDETSTRGGLLCSSGKTMSFDEYPCRWNALGDGRDNQAGLAPIETENLSSINQQTQNPAIL